MAHLLLCLLLSAEVDGNELIASPSPEKVLSAKSALKKTCRRADQLISLFMAPGVIGPLQKIDVGKDHDKVCDLFIPDSLKQAVAGAAVGSAGQLIGIGKALQALLLDPLIGLPGILHAKVKHDGRKQDQDCRRHQGLVQELVLIAVAIGERKPDYLGYANARG